MVAILTDSLFGRTGKSEGGWIVIRAKPEDINVLAQLIDRRESAELAGVKGAFTFTPFQGGQGLAVGPGRSGSLQVSTFDMGRLDELGAFRVLNRSARGGFTFDLVDDVRDLLEEWRTTLGQPSRMGELEAALARATGEKEQALTAMMDLERRSARVAEGRTARRDAAATRVGRRIRRLFVVVLAVAYMAVYMAVVLVGFLATSNPLAAAGIVIAGGLLALLGWVSPIDGFWLAGKAESIVSRRVRRWLDSLD
jgi:hypothetical protein